MKAISTSVYILIEQSDNRGLVNKKRGDPPNIYNKISHRTHFKG